MADHRPSLLVPAAVTTLLFALGVCVYVALNALFGTTSFADDPAVHPSRAAAVLQAPEIPPQTVETPRHEERRSFWSSLQWTVGVDRVDGETRLSLRVDPPATEGPACRLKLGWGTRNSHVQLDLGDVVAAVRALTD